MKKILLVIGILLLCGCKVEKEKKLNKVIYTMDTTIDITLYEGTKDDLVNIADIFYQYNYLADYNKHYNGYVNVFDLNKDAYKEEMVISSDLFEILETSVEYYELLFGYTNIAIGAASFKWKEIKDSFDPNTFNGMDELVNNLSNTSINDLVLNKEKLSVKYNNEFLKLDLGGVVKGFALNKAKCYLEGKGYSKYLINAGTSSILLGKNLNKDTFNVGLTNPLNEHDVYCGIRVGNKSISTSGDYQNYFEYNGSRYHHILNPKTLKNENIYRSVTLIGEDPYLLDALSTAIFSMKLDDAKNLVDKLNVAMVYMLYYGTIGSYGEVDII